MSEVAPTKVQFAEAVDHLKSKLPESSLAWDDLAGPVHAKVFTVAGATSADLARDIQGALVDALRNGKTITDFRKQFDRAVEEHGWSYNGSRGWRTDVIFDNNMRSAHMAGRWAQIQANKDRRPFLQYRTAGDMKVRPAHRQWNGLIFPVGDAFWQTHYPPCGWGCRCTVRAYAQRDLDEKNLRVSPPFEGKTRDVVVAGQVVDHVPVGVDPGWDHNVGEAWISPELALGAKLARLPAALRGPMVDKTITPAFQEAITERWKAFRATSKGGSIPEGQAQVVGYLDSAIINGLATAAPELQLQSTMVGAFDHQVADLEGAAKSAPSPLKGWPNDWVDDLPDAVRNYQAVLWDTEAKTLVVVPMGSFNERLPTVTIRPNVATKFAQEAASVESLGSSSSADLRSKRYVLLTGQIK